MERTDKPAYLLPLLLALLVIAGHMIIVEARGYMQNPIGNVNHNKLSDPKSEHSDHKKVGGDSCKPGATHTRCSPPVTKHTKATLTLNSFERGGDGGGPSECDGQYHSDDTLIVALSTGWYNGGKRCHKFVKINGNGRSVKAKVVDECDCLRGCKNNIVDVSKAVWKALGIKPGDGRYGWMDVTWSDA